MAFLGSLVQVTLGDGTVQGVLTSLNTFEGTLELRQASRSGKSGVLPSLVLQRSQVAAPATRSVSFSDPAILSVRPITCDAASKTRTDAQVGRPTSVPAEPARSILASSSNSTATVVPTQAAARQPSTANTRKKKKKAALLLHPRGSEADESSALAYEDSYDESAGFTSEDEGVATGAEVTGDEYLRRPRAPLKGKKTNRRAISAAAQPQTNGTNGDFDFAGGLARFDKQKVFAEISALDKSDPSLLLVAHNRRINVDERYTTKLLPTENVLDDTSTAEVETSGTEAGWSEAPLQTLPPPSLQPRMARRASSKALRGVIHGPKGPAQLLTMKQYKEVEVFANVETGPNLLQRIENGGRSIAQLVLDPQAGFGADELAVEGRPIVVLLVGTQGTKGSYALRAGAHLMNHGAVVTAYLAEDKALPAKFEMHLRLFSSAGGDVARSIHELPTAPDVVIDGLLDSDNGIKARSSDFEAMKWANGTSAPTLSVHWPSGADADTAAAIQEAISPAATICLGAVCRGAEAGPSTTGALWLADIGLPVAAFERVQGLENWTSPFDRSFAVHMRFE